MLKRILMIICWVMPTALYASEEVQFATVISAPIASFSVMEVTDAADPNVLTTQVVEGGENAMVNFCLSENTAEGEIKLEGAAATVDIPFIELNGASSLRSDSNGEWRIVADEAQQWPEVIVGDGFTLIGKQLLADNFYFSSKSTSPRDVKVGKKLLMGANKEIVTKVAGVGNLEIKNSAEVSQVKFAGTGSQANPPVAAWTSFRESYLLYSNN